MIREHQFQSQLESYSKSFLKNLGYKAQYKLSEDAINQRNYDGLKHLLTHADFAYQWALDVAIDKLDVEAIRVICSVKWTAAHYEGYLARLLKKRYYEYTAKEEQERKTAIYKLLLSNMEKEVITSPLLKYLSYKVPKKEFDGFCKSKNIDNSILSTLDLFHYTANDTKPLLELQDDSRCIVDMMLSITYSTVVSVERMRVAYNALVQLDDELSKELLTYLSMQIANNNTIKIVISRGAWSSYDIYTNIVKIDSDLLHALDWTIESTIIHELGHWFYNTLFYTGCLPMDRTWIQKLSSHDNDYNDASAAQSFESLKKETNDNLNKFHEDLPFAFDYYKAARLPTYKAATLLNFDIKLLDNFVRLGDRVHMENYFISNSNISLFLLPAVDRSMDLNLTSIPSLGVAILDIYQTQCFEDTFAEEEHVRERHILDWASETYLPQVVRDLNLDSMQVHFLELIADYLFRESDGDYNERTVELIVRRLELKSMGMHQDLVDSFNGLAAFHKQYISPVVQEQLGEYTVAPFDYCNNYQQMIDGMRDLADSMSSKEVALYHPDF